MTNPVPAALACLHQRRAEALAQREQIKAWRPYLLTADRLLDAFGEALTFALGNYAVTVEPRSGSDAAHV